jgi:hypothetical protein
MSSSTETVVKKSNMRDEYDFSHAVMVTLDPDVAAALPDADSVNEALRAGKKAAPAA